MTVPSLLVYVSCVFVKTNSGLFLRNRDVSDNINTRGRDDLFMPLHHTSLFHKGPLVSCIKIFNMLPMNLKTVQGLGSFKNKLKTFLTENEFYSLEEYFSS